MTSRVFAALALFTLTACSKPSPPQSPADTKPGADGRKAAGPVSAPIFEGCKTELGPERDPARPVLSRKGSFDLVEIAPGESLCFETSLEGHIVRLGRLVPTRTAEGHFVSLSFGMLKEQRALVVRHDEARNVAYMAAIVVPTRDGKWTARETSTCVVRPGIFSAELWNEPVAVVTLGGFHLTNESGCK